MKMLKVFVVVIYLNTVKCGKTLNYEKFTKVECSSSNKTCINPYCNLKPYSRTTVYMNFGCDLMKPLTNTRFAAINWIKSLSGGYRQIMNLKDIDVCKVLSHLKDFPMFQGQVDWLNTTFPGFAHPCPYTSFKVFNASIQPNDDRSKYDIKLPNGSYKVKFQGSDDSDDNIFQLTFYYEVRYHFNVFDFK